jgi:hypothetical protein
MAHIKGMFVTRGFDLPTVAKRFSIDLPATDYAVHGVIPEGAASVLVIEYSLPAERTREVEFETVADDVVHSGLPSDHVYIGTYSTLGGGRLHVYGPRGVADRRIPTLRPLM